MIPTIDLAGFEQLAAARRTSLLVDQARAVPDELLERLITVATWAPNHKRTWPWQFTVCVGDGRRALGERFAAAMVAAGASDDARLAKTRQKYTRSPAVVLVGSAPHPDPALDVENRDAVAAAVQNLLLGATAAGLASFWSTPPVERDDDVAAFAGFAPGTRFVAVVYLGWPSSSVEVPERPAPLLTWRR